MSEENESGAEDARDAERREIFDRFEGRYALYTSRMTSIMDREAATAASMLSTSAQFALMTLRSLLQFNLAAVLGVPAIVLSGANAPTGDALYTLASGIVVMFIAGICAGLASHFAYKNYDQLSQLAYTAGELHRHDARGLLQPYATKDDAPDAKRREIAKKSDDIGQRADHFTFLSHVAGWSSVGFTVIGVFTVGYSLIAAQPAP